MNDTSVMRVEWATVTGVLGPNLRGIFPPATDITDVNSTCRSKDERLLATGDDFGHVKLFNYPVTVSGGAWWWWWCMVVVVHGDGGGGAWWWWWWRFNHERRFNHARRGCV